MHRIDTALEDNTASDDDPAAGSVAWKGGAIHVVAGDFGVHGTWNGTAYEPATLRIRPSAIVTFAQQCTLDGKGVIVNTAVPDATCGDPGGDGQISASDALVALRSSLGSSSCEPCVCDVNQSGGITASDALQILRVAVGLAEAPTCAACVE